MKAYVLSFRDLKLEFKVARFLFHLLSKKFKQKFELEKEKGPAVKKQQGKAPWAGFGRSRPSGDSFRVRGAAIRRKADSGRKN